MAYRDIDYSTRINGDLSVPGHSVHVGNNLTLHHNGNITAKTISGTFSGDGSALTNLSSNAMTDVLRLNGSRVMSGNLVISKADAAIVLRASTNTKDVGGLEILEGVGRFSDSTANGFRLGYDGSGNSLNLKSKYNGAESNHITIHRLGSMIVDSDITVNGNIALTGTVDSVDVSKLKSDFDTHTHSFSSITGRPTTLSGYGITAQYYTKSEINTKYDGQITDIKSSISKAETDIKALDGSLDTAKTDLQGKIDEVKNSFEGMTIGGRNLIESFTSGKWTNLGATNTEVVTDYRVIFKAGSNNTSRYNLTLEPNTDYTMTFNSDHQRYYIYRVENGVSTTIVKTVSEGSDVYTFNTGNITEYQLMLNAWSERVNVNREVWDLKLEKSNIQSDWSPAPEDIKRKIDEIHNMIQDVHTELNKKADKNHTHEYLDAPDLRNSALTPGEIQNRSISAFFTTNSNAGSPPVSNGSTYAHILNMNGWNSANAGTGGHTSQLAFGDGLSVRISKSTTSWGEWRNLWHTGNLNPADYIGKGNNQRVGNGFGINGRLLVGNVSGQSGDVVVYNGSGAPTIHLDGDASGIENLTNTKVHIDGLGNANFRETVTVKNLTSLSHTKTETLETERINNIRTVNYAKNQSVIDASGWGIHSALDAIAYGGELHVNPGIAFTNTGMRVEVLAREKVVMTPVSTSGDRYDVAYIKGSSAGIEEGKLGYFEGSVGGTEAAVLSSGSLSDAVILATVHRKRSQASITQANINNEVRTNDGITGVKPLIVEPDNRNVLARYEMHASRYKEDGKYINTIYSTLAGGNTFTSNQTFNGRVSIMSTGALAGSSSSSNYSLRVGTSSHQMRVDGKDILGNSDINLVANNNLTLKGQNLNLDGKVAVPSQASTVSVPAGQTSVTWTHNYGKTSYAVNFTTNSFERHIKWSNKTANSITVEIDDPTDKVVLVDCILIGY